MFCEAEMFCEVDLCNRHPCLSGDTCQTTISGGYQNAYLCDFPVDRTVGSGGMMYGWI